MKLNKSFFYIFIVVDILFLPFVRSLPFISSTFLIIFWFFLNYKKILIDKRAFLILIIAFFASISTLFAFFKTPEIIFFDDALINAHEINFITLILLFFFFIYFIFFKIYSYARLNVLINVLIFYLFFNFFLAVVFWFDYDLYFRLREFWTYDSSKLEVGKFSSTTRFMGIFSDPNNASVAIVAVYLFLMISNFSLKKFVILSFITLFVVISTMSSVGIISYLIAFLSLFIYFLVFNRMSLSKFIFYLLLTIIVFIAVNSDLFRIVKDSQVVSVALDRFATNSFASRFEKIELYISFDNLLNMFLVGQGGTIFIDGGYNKPHIGHLHIIFNYGMIAWLIFLFVFFMIRFNLPLIAYLPTFIIFLGFSSNTGIIDFRFALLSALLLGVYHSKIYATKLNNK
jgi:hypothetical protein